MSEWHIQAKLTRDCTVVVDADDKEDAEDKFDELHWEDSDDGELVDWECISIENADDE